MSDALKQASLYRGKGGAKQNAQEIGAGAVRGSAARPNTNKRNFPHHKIIMEPK